MDALFYDAQSAAIFSNHCIDASSNQQQQYQLLMREGSTSTGGECRLRWTVGWTGSAYICQHVRVVTLSVRKLKYHQGVRKFAQWHLKMAAHLLCGFLTWRVERHITFIWTFGVFNSSKLLLNHAADINLTGDLCSVYWLFLIAGVFLVQQLWGNRLPPWGACQSSNQSNKIFLSGWK